MVKKNKQSKKKYYIHPQYEKLESAWVHETLQRV
jgi:hypothetical protein